MEKRNVVAEGRTPAKELEDKNADWDKKASECFKPKQEAKKEQEG